MREVKTEGEGPMLWRDRIYWWMMAPALLWIDVLSTLFGVEIEIKVRYDA